MTLQEKFDSIIDCIERLVYAGESDIPQALARESGFNLRLLGDAFQFIADMTLIKYIRQRRLVRALSNRIEFDLPVEEVVSDAGFSDAAAFSKACKNEFDLTPIQITEDVLKKYTPLSFAMVASGRDVDQINHLYATISQKERDHMPTSLRLPNRKYCISLFLVATLLLILFCGCSQIEIKDHPTIRQHVDTMLDSLLTGKLDGAYDTVSDLITSSTLPAAFAEMRSILSGVETYELTPIQMNYVNQNGIKSTYYTYRMVTNADVFVVSAAIAEGYDGLVSFSIIPESQTKLAYTGIPGHMQGANILQWAILILGLLTWVFVIWVFVDCCRHKFKRKWLWLLIILLGALILSFNYSNNHLGFQVNAGLYLTFSSLIVFSDNAAQLKLVIPLGAIIYLLCKKKRFRAKQDFQEIVPDVTETSIPVSEIIE